MKFKQILFIKEIKLTKQIYLKKQNRESFGMIQFVQKMHIQREMLLYVIQ